MKKFISFYLLTLLMLSPLAGQNWSPLKRLSRNPYDSSYPKVAADPKGGIHVVWEDWAPLNNEITYRRSTDGGATWSRPTQLTLDGGSFATIAADATRGIHVVYINSSLGSSEIFYKRSSNRGKTWSEPTRLTFSKVYTSYPSIAVDKRKGIHVVWQDKSPSEIFYRRSPNRGKKWKKRTRLTTNAGRSGSPSIATDASGGIHVVWEDDTPGNFEIFYIRSTDGGATWSEPKQLTRNTGVSSWPVITADADNGIHVAWSDNTPPEGSEIFYARSTDGGTTWSEPIRLTQLAGCSEFPAIAADSGNGIHIVWSDEVPGGYNQIYYKYSYDKGATWNAWIRLTRKLFISYYPSVAADSNGVVHFIWQMCQTEYSDIFYRNFR